MKIKTGEKTRLFSTEDIYGNTISIEDYKGKKLLLCFFRNVNCPFCNLRIHELNKVRETFEKKGLYMAFVFESGAQQLRDSMFHKKVSPITLISDPDRELYQLYGIEESALKMMMTFANPAAFTDMRAAKQLATLPKEEKHVSQKIIPADFLIDENQNIAMVKYGKNVRDHLFIYEIENYLQQHPLPQPTENEKTVPIVGPKAKIKVIQPNEAEGKLKEIYDQIKEKRGQLAEVHKIQSLRPKSIVHHMNLYMEIMYSRSPLSRAEREMMAVVVSSSNKCSYCTHHHGEALNHYWRDQAKVSQLAENFKAVQLSEREAALCAFAAQVTLYPKDADKATDQLIATNFTDQEILDATLVTAYFNFVNRIVLSLGVPLETHDHDSYKY